MMYLRLRPRTLFTGAIVVLCTTIVSMYAAANAVPGSRADQVDSPVLVSQLAPTACAGLGLTARVVGNGLVFGGAANELIIGGAGADLIAGGAGNDCLVGGAGGDLLTGGAGNDVCIGGPGGDSFAASCETQIP